MLIDRRMEKAALAAGTADLPEVRAGIARAPECRGARFR